MICPIVYLLLPLVCCLQHRSVGLGAGYSEDRSLPTPVTASHSAKQRFLQRVTENFGAELARDLQPQLDHDLQLQPFASLVESFFGAEAVAEFLASTEEQASAPQGPVQPAASLEASLEPDDKFVDAESSRMDVDDISSDVEEVDEISMTAPAAPSPMNPGVAMLFEPARDPPLGRAALGSTGVNARDPEIAYSNDRRLTLQNNGLARFVGQLFTGLRERLPELRPRRVGDQALKSFFLEGRERVLVVFVRYLTDRG